MAESEPRGEGMTAPPPRAEHEVGDRATDPGIYPMASNYTRFLKHQGKPTMWPAKNSGGTRRNDPTWGGGGGAASGVRGGGVRPHGAPSRWPGPPGLAEPVPREAGEFKYISLKPLIEEMWPTPTAQGSVIAALGTGCNVVLAVLASIIMGVVALCGKQAVNADQALQDVHQNVMARGTLRRSVDWNPEELPGHTNSRVSLSDILPRLDVGNEGNKDLEAENRALKQALVILMGVITGSTSKH